MPSTYTLISSNTLGSAAASVTFSAIPSTYTDLVIKASIRTTAGGVASSYIFRLNGDTATNYSQTRIEGNGSSASSGRTSSTSLFVGYYPTASGATTNTFANHKIYIPNYLSTTSKQLSLFGVTENNATQSYIDEIALLYRGTSAISSIVFDGDGYNFVSGSSFYLYGIKNS
jgi:hypothetical protein